jgi:AAA family ATP:ADP antiporter
MSPAQRHEGDDQQPDPAAPLAATPALAPQGRVAGLLARAVGARPGELSVEAPAVAMGFLLFGGYSLMKPLRDAANTVVSDRLGEYAVAGLTTATLAAMVGATALSGAAVTLLGWRRIFMLAQGLWVVAAAVFAGLFGLSERAAAQGAAGWWWIGAVLIVWVNVFNLLSLSFMWSRVSDAMSGDQARRLYPVVGLGITLGGIAGSWTVKTYAKSFSPSVFLWGAAAMLLASAAAAAWLSHSAERMRQHRAERDDGSGRARAGTGAAGGERSTGSARGLLAGAAEGVALVAKSPFLLGLCVYLFLYTTTGTILWFEQQRIVRASWVSVEERTAAFATIDLYTNLVTIVLQGLVAGRLLSWMGIAAALTVTPFTTAIGAAVLWAQPALGPLIAVQVGRRGLHFAIDRPGREALYTAVSPAERHKAKGFIDTFVYRLGDQAGAWLQAGLGSIGAGSVYTTVGACAVWAGLGVWLGRRMKRREAAAKG